MLCGVRSEEAEDDGSGSSLITITSGIGFLLLLFLRSEARVGIYSEVMVG